MVDVSPLLMIFFANNVELRVVICFRNSFNVELKRYGSLQTICRPSLPLSKSFKRFRGMATISPNPNLA